jgi:structural maintenance of chromosome 4
MQDSTRGSVDPSSKAPATPSSRASARTSTCMSVRPSCVLQEVAETEDEEELVKKSRNSVEGEDHDEDEIIWRQGK